MTSLHDASARGFASDNYAGICPEAWDAMAAANQGSVPAYGEDPWTKRAADAEISPDITDMRNASVMIGTS
mgnify:CR=1 FL=1